MYTMKKMSWSLKQSVSDQINFLKYRYVDWSILDDSYIAHQLTY